MNFGKFLQFIVLFFVFASFAYSIGVYDQQGDYVYYISNPTPYINATISSPAEPVIVEGASLILNDNKIDVNVGQEIAPGGEEKFSFNVRDFGVSNLSESDNVFFNLNAVGYDGKEIRPKGDPTSFQIMLDNTVPLLVLPEGEIVYVSPSDNLLELVFSEKLSKYVVKVNGNIVNSYTEQSSFLKDYRKSFDISLDTSSISEGQNTLVIDFVDIAGNKNSKTFSLNYRNVDLKVSLVTRKQDSSLPYFYDRDYVDFFNGSIYSSSDSFDLVVRTNKVANCYLANNLLSFKSFQNVVQKESFDSSDGFTHSIAVEVTDSPIWVACQNPIYADDVSYLNQEMDLFGSLISIKKYNGPVLSITSAMPDVSVSSVPFNIEAMTNAKAICHYSVDGSEKVLLESQTGISHTFSNLVVNNGTHSIQFSCFDKVYNTASKTNSILVDTENGVKITSFSPKYTDQSSLSILLSLSEDSICKVSEEQVSASSFGNLNTLSGTGLSRTLSVSNLERGSNVFYIYCDKDNEIWSNQIDIIYDSEGPQLANFSFVNGGIESLYANSKTELSFVFDVISLIPVNSYFVEVVGNMNESYNEVISSNEATIIGDFDGAQTISIVAQNLIGTNSSKLEAVVRFDITDPVINFNMLGDSIKISCFDVESGCYEIKYGLSMTAIDCNPRIDYNVNESIEIGESNYLCAWAIDNAGNIGEDQKILTFFFDADNLSNDRLDNLTESLDDNESSGSYVSDPFTASTYDLPDDGSNVLIYVGMVFLVVAGLGSGGYYAYRKGYLDEQLKKLGIQKVQNGQTIGSVPSSNKTSRDSFSSSGKTKDNKKYGKSSYDEHLGRLNKFIDDTLHKGTDVFKKFEGVDKGKVEGYDDTLLKGEIKKVSKEDLDEFYSSKSSSVSTKENSDSLEKEAEEFEKYYKSRQTPDNKDKKK